MCPFPSQSCFERRTEGWRPWARVVRARTAWGEQLLGLRLPRASQDSWDSAAIQPACRGKRPQPSVCSQIGGRLTTALLLARRQGRPHEGAAAQRSTPCLVTAWYTAARAAEAAAGSKSWRSQDSSSSRRRVRSCAGRGTGRCRRGMAAAKSDAASSGGRAVPQAGRRQQHRHRQRRCASRQLSAAQRSAAQRSAACRAWTWTSPHHSLWRQPPVELRFRC